MRLIVFFFNSKKSFPLFKTMGATCALLSVVDPLPFCFRGWRVPTRSLVGHKSDNLSDVGSKMTKSESKKVRSTVIYKSDRKSHWVLLNGFPESQTKTTTVKTVSSPYYRSNRDHSLSGIKNLSMCRRQGQFYL